MAVTIPGVTNGNLPMDVLGKDKKEWTSDWYAADYYVYSPSRNPQGPQSGVFRAVPGCSGLPATWGLRNDLLPSPTPSWCRVPGREGLVHSSLTGMGDG